MRKCELKLICEHPCPMAYRKYIVPAAATCFYATSPRCLGYGLLKVWTRGSKLPFYGLNLVFQSFDCVMWAIIFEPCPLCAKLEKERVLF